MGIAALVRRLDTAGLKGLLQGRSLKYVRSAAAPAKPELTIGQYLHGQRAIAAYQDIQNSRDRT